MSLSQISLFHPDHWPDADIGVPAVAVGAPTFIAQIHSTGVNRGVPVLRTAEYPGAFASHSEKELREYTRTIVWLH